MTVIQIDTKDIPQADLLQEVVKAVEAISSGMSSFQGIAKYLGLTGRQGRYYRLATEILGFTDKVSTNVSTLTPLGRKLLHSTFDQRKEILRNQVLTVPVVQSVLGMLASSSGSASRRDLEHAIKVMAGTTEGMAGRRLTTILSWLDDLNIAKRSGNSVRLWNLPSQVKTIEISDLGVPVLPKPSELRRFEEVPRKLRDAKGIIKFEVDAAKHERANNIHEKLRSLVADRIRRCGACPTSNRYIDLATRLGTQDYIIEVKSSGGNVRNLVRRGISQLYEYRYLQGMFGAGLVLCLEKPLTGKNEWYLDYLTHDRAICVIWDAQNDDLFTTDECKAVLPFMT